MVVKGAAFGAVDVGTVSVEAVVGRRLTLSYVLAVLAEGAVAQVYAITTFAIEVVLDLFRSWPQNEFLTPKQLSIKTITILSLIGIPRKAEMHLFDLNYFADHAYYATFDLVGTVKNVGEEKKARARKARTDRREGGRNSRGKAQPGKQEIKEVA